MQANPTLTVGALQRVVATLVASALIMTSFGVYSKAQAANLTSISDTLTDSDLSVVSDHTLAFTVPAGSPGLLAGETITVTFPAGFNMGSVAFGDIDFSINTVDQTLAATQSGATWGAAVSSQTLTITSGTGVLSAGDVVEIQIGTNADSGTNQITNPGVAGSYEIFVTAGAADTGRTRVAIIDNVLVTAVVDTVFDFTIAGLATSSPVNGTTTTGATTATDVPFGTLTAGLIVTLAQQLNVTTNAVNGYAVTVEQDGDLLSSNGANIDGFTDGSYVDTPTAWASPGGTLGNVNEYGHWGMTSSDGDLQTLGNDFGVDEWIAASTTPRVIMAHDGVADGTDGNDDASGDDVGQTIIGYQIEITSLQEAADDYNTTLTYIATPTF